MAYSHIHLLYREPMASTNCGIQPYTPFTQRTNGEYELWHTTIYTFYTENQRGVQMVTYSQGGELGREKCAVEGEYGREACAEEAKSA